MKVGIMQPYFFPYIGYFQLMNAVDEFVVYDNIEYTKKGWINRNRILVNGSDSYFTVPLKKQSDYLDVRERQLSDSWPDERKKLANKIRETYRRAPFFTTAYPAIEACLLHHDDNLFGFIFHSLSVMRQYLDISSKLTVSSTIDIDHSLRSAEKVMRICQARGADTYINPIGGTVLYEKEIFRENGLSLLFIKSNEIQYTQFENQFVPWLSILDVMMFNSRDEIGRMINSYSLI